MSSLNDYQRHAERTAGKYVAINDTSVMGAALGLTGEAGEVADLIKKHFMQDHPWDSNKVAEELGDVLWYVAIMARRIGFTLEEIALLNVEKLLKRYPVKFEAERSINRDGG